MTLAELILAAMISLQPPGNSAYSLVPVDAECAKTTECRDAAPPPPCDNYLCEKKAFLAPGHGKTGTYFRYETPAQGKERYLVIAEAIANETQKAVDDGRWPGPPEELAAYVTSIVFNESGFRRDVHSGKGPNSKGDNNRSYCLGQILLGEWRRAEGTEKIMWNGKDLVGVDPEHTSRCIGVVVNFAARAKYPRCGKHTTSTCVFAGYGGIANPRNDLRIKARNKTFEKVRVVLDEFKR